MKAASFNPLGLSTKRPTTKGEIISYLVGHFRYYTMNSWNRSTSYAHKIKIYDLDLTIDQRNLCLDALSIDDAWEASGVLEVLRDFDTEHDYRYQIASNGRSSGYLVLIQGGKRPGYKSVCTSCGQGNYKTVEDDSGRCGRCHQPTRVNRNTFHVFTQPGLSLDQGEDFADWELSALKDRRDLAWDFDQACSDAVKMFVEWACNIKPVKETILVPKTITVARPR